jgi:hypothetical protein
MRMEENVCDDKRVRQHKLTVRAVLVTAGMKEIQLEGRLF